MYHYFNISFLFSLSHYTIHLMTRSHSCCICTFVRFDLHHCNSFSPEYLATTILVFIWNQVLKKSFGTLHVTPYSICLSVLCMVYFIQHSALSVHLYSFLLQYSLVWTTLCSSATGRHLGGFLFLIILTCGAINICVQVFMWTYDVLSFE